MIGSANIFDLSTKTVLITGASSGFGRHFASVLSAAGATVVLAARRAEKLAEAVQEIEQAGGRASAIAMDVSNEASVEQAFAAMPAIDVVINNAGINIISLTTELKGSEWDQIIDTNLKGVWLVSREAIKCWQADSRPGNIINIASILGFRVSNQLSAYAASKAGVVQFTKSLALDYARDNIRSNAICPGYFETDINRDFMQTAPGQKQIKRIPLRRMGQLHELDGPLLLLASDASSYMSGTCMQVDGAHVCSTL